MLISFVVYIVLLSGLIVPLTEYQFFFNIKRTFRETGHQVYHASYSPDGKYILTTGSDNSIIIWNAESGIIYRTLTGLKKKPNIALFSPNNEHILSAGEDNMVSMWDPVGLKISHTFTGHQGPVKSLDISPDGRFIASGSSDKTIRIWEINDKNLLYELKAHKNIVNAVAFHPDGSILATGGADKTIILWSVRNGNIITSRSAHNSWIRDIAFSPDGKLLASCGDDNLIHIWQLPELTRLSTLKGHRSWVQTIDFSPDSRTLISGGHDQLVILWDIFSGKALYQTDKLGHIVLSVDICPVRPDFISSCLLSEEIRTWALSGLDLAQWKSIPGKVLTKEKIKETRILSEQLIDKDKSIPEEEDHSLPLSQSNPLIEIFSPLPVRGKVTHDKNEILFIGRVSDPDGISAFLINGRHVKFSDAGVFQFNMRLEPGENLMDIFAVNSSGNLNEQRIFIECIADKSSLQQQLIPDISRSRYFALLIGVNDYSDNNILDLDNPIKDAESLKQVLISKYTFENDNVILLNNPSRAELMLTLDDLGRKLTQNDNLLIFFAGHGYWDEKGKVGYWLPSDANSDNTVNWFRNSTLRDFIGSIQTRHTMLIADACFSGAIFKTRAAFTDAPKSIHRLYELPSRKAMTSGILQEVPDESVFLKFLIKRLDENEEKYLPSEAFFSSFKTAVMNNSSNVPQFGIIQNVGDEGGDFIFIKK